MGTPHKHAALIKAWAADTNLQFQFRGGGLQSCCWYTMNTPDWSHQEIRIKPQTIKYRPALFGKLTNKPYVLAVNEGSEIATNGSDNFIKWIGDWQEVEV